MLCHSSELGVTPGEAPALPLDVGNNLREVGGLNPVLVGSIPEAKQPHVGSNTHLHVIANTCQKVLQASHSRLLIEIGSGRASLDFNCDDIVSTCSSHWTLKSTQVQLLTISGHPHMCLESVQTTPCESKSGRW